MHENESRHFVYVVRNDGKERHALQTRASGGIQIRDILGTTYN